MATVHDLRENQLTDEGSRWKEKRVLNVERNDVELGDLDLATLQQIDTGYRRKTNWDKEEGSEVAGGSNEFAYVR